LSSIISYRFLPFQVWILISMHNSNAEQFCLDGGIDISYWPSQIGTQTCSLHFKSTTVGGWHFNLQGVGLPPTTMATTVLIATIETSGLTRSNNTKNLRCTENLKIVNVLDRDVTAFFRIVSDEQLASGMLRDMQHNINFANKAYLKLPCNGLRLRQQVFCPSLSPFCLPVCPKQVLPSPQLCQQLNLI
jgi:hypothetical protein